MVGRFSKTTQYQYYMTSFQVMIPGRKKPIECRVNFFDIEKDFDNDLFTILRVNAALKPDEYFDIITNRIKAKFRVRIDKVAMDVDQPSGMKETVVNDTFILFIDDDDAFLDKDLYKTTKGVSGDGTDPTDFREPRDLFLFREKDIACSKKVIHGVLTQAKMIEAVTYLLSGAGFSNMLVTNFDNMKPHKEVILLPTTVLKNIEYLDFQYGFYRYGKTMFFDWKYGYIFKRRGINMAFAPNEYRDVRVLINKTINPNSLTSGTYKNSKEKVYEMHVVQDNVLMLSESATTDQVKGNKILAINPSSGNISTHNTNTKQIGIAKTDIVVNKYDNLYSNTKLTYGRHENDSIMQVGLSDIDIDSLMPTKRYIFSFEDANIQKEKGGVYRLSSIKFDFSNQGTNRFKISATAIFKKPEPFVG